MKSVSFGPGANAWFDRLPVTVFVRANLSGNNFSFTCTCISVFDTKQDSVGPSVRQYGSRPLPLLEQPIQTVILKCLIFTQTSIF